MRPSRRLVALTVDLDELDCYRAIHGLAPGGGEAPIYDRGVPRFGELFAREGVRGTFFAVGRDAQRPERAVRLRELAGAGHELANHSLSHYYDLVRRPPSVLVAEVSGGRAAIQDAVGVAAVGFRAPGYTLSAELVDVLGDLGVAYDSSVLPSPAYFAARAAAIVIKALRGRRSRSLFAGFELSLAPRRPYVLSWPPFVRGTERVGDRGGGLRELPIATIPWARVPVLGTTIVLAGAANAVRLCRLLSGDFFVNLELHGIDLCAPDDPGVAALGHAQPDARVPLSRKTTAIEAVIRHFRGEGAEFVTLAEAAELAFQKPLKG
ncbi:MAG: polysaccharide deacetylase family protein [Deltaproteobacteria bacterium]|nr:polysaccharide deacetylase family protein [Deltaproteobacteria bacterium]